MAYTIAALAVETSIPPREFMEMDEEMLRHIIQVLNDRAKEIKNATKRNRR
jgi:phage I-like protein